MEADNRQEDEVHMFARVLVGMANGQRFETGTSSGTVPDDRA